LQVVEMVQQIGLRKRLVVVAVVQLAVTGWFKWREQCVANGGAGVAVSITGSSVTYAGGGGGGIYWLTEWNKVVLAQVAEVMVVVVRIAPQAATAGTANTGGGGGGRWTLLPQAQVVSGIVIVRYAI
jgi:hypothetical protein